MYVAVCFLIILMLVAVGIITFWLVLVKWRSVKNNSHGDEADSVSSISTDLEKGALPRKFSYIELVAATKDFANGRRLGQGGSGQVYKGDLGDLGRPVAVKRIFTECQHSRSLFINELYLAGDILNAADERLSLCMGFNQDEMECLLIVGLWCTHPNSKERPKTEQVIKVLQLEAPLPELSRDDMHHLVFQPIPPPHGQGDSFQPSITSSLNFGGR
ncbi:L-type lectin-domain containing receptor kinase IX.1-like [Fagus crenata]